MLDIHFRCTVRLETPGLERAIIAAGHEIAGALELIAEALQNPIVRGQLFVDKPLGGPFMINPALPQHLTAVWTRADGSPGFPDSVDYSLDNPALGTIVPDPGNPTGGAIFTAASPDTSGPVTFTAVAHQAGFPDVSCSVSDQITPVPPPNPIVSGTLTLDPQ